MLNKLKSPPRIFEKSIFLANEPRDGQTKVHLFLVVICLIATLLFAIIFAEMRGTKFPIAAQRGQSHDTSMIYGKSE